MAELDDQWLLIYYRINEPGQPWEIAPSKDEYGLPSLPWREKHSPLRPQQAFVRMLQLQSRAFYGVAEWKLVKCTHDGIVLESPNPCQEG